MRALADHMNALNAASALGGAVTAVQQIQQSLLDTPGTSFKERLILDTPATSIENQIIDTPATPSENIVITTPATPEENIIITTPADISEQPIILDTPAQRLEQDMTGVLESGITEGEEINGIAYPGDDPSLKPGEDYEWRGRGTPESGRGNWYNPKTGERLNPDLDHGPPIGPHWDYTDKDGNRFRLYPDGTMIPKKK